MNGTLVRKESIEDAEANRCKRQNRQQHVHYPIACHSSAGRAESGRRSRPSRLTVPRTGGTGLKEHECRPVSAVRWHPSTSNKLWGARRPN
jgi:hypothetical protein